MVIHQGLVCSDHSINYCIIIKIRKRVQNKQIKPNVTILWWFNRFYDTRPRNEVRLATDTKEPIRVCISLCYWCNMLAIRLSEKLDKFI